MHLYRANNKRGYLQDLIIEASTQMTLQDNEYIDAARDRNIPEVAGVSMHLVIWGYEYPAPSMDPNREIVLASWTGSGHVFNIARGQDGTNAHLHYMNDNVALLYTSLMSWEPCIFKDMLDEVAGTIGSTFDTDADGDMEVVPILPDDEYAIDKYGEEYDKILVTAGPGALPYWDFSWNIGGDEPPEIVLAERESGPP